MDTIGERISGTRRANNFTQNELSEKLGVSRELVNLWENDMRKIKGDDIAKLADALETTCDYLLRGIVIKNPELVNTEKLISSYTGLTEKAIEAIKKLDRESLEGLNAFLEGIADK